MIFNRDIAFIHVPKTGGMALSKRLVRVLAAPVHYTQPEPDKDFPGEGIVHVPGLRHETLSEARVVMARHGYDIRNCRMILAVVRNPYAMEVSRYTYLQQGHEWDAGENQRLALEDDFETFALHSVDHGGADRPIQGYFLLDGKVPANLRILHCEGLDAEARAALAEIGIDMGETLQRDNATNHAPYSEYYTQITAAAVERRYAWVFENGYYPRMEPGEFRPIEKIPLAGPRIPLQGPVRQVGQSAGMRDDLWIGRRLRFQVKPTEAVDAVEIEGHCPARAEGPRLAVVTINGIASTLSYPEPGTFRWQIAASLPAGAVARIRITPSSTFRAGDLAMRDGNRQISLQLKNVSFRPGNGPHHANGTQVQSPVPPTTGPDESGSPAAQATPPKWCDVANELLRCAADESQCGDAIRLLAQAACLMMRPASRRRAFRIWQEFGIHLTPVSVHSPIPDSRTLDEAIWTRESKLPGIDLNVAGQLELVAEAFPRFREEYDSFPRYATDCPHEFYFDNNQFGGTDALALYCMVRHFRPRRITHIGAGFASRISARAGLQNGPTELICIDPNPDAIHGAGFPGLTRVLRQTAQTVSLEEFEQLQSGDMLIIDSSHVARIGSDVNFLFLDILPRLRPGVIVQIHDIFLPGDYPQDWILHDMRFWNEQYLLQAFLAFNSEYQVLLSNSYLGRQHNAVLRETFPNSPWWGGGSFWMRRKVKS